MQIFVTENIKLAAALASAGFVILEVERIQSDSTERVSFSFEPESKFHKVSANAFQAAYENKTDLASEVDAIIKSRGITPEEYAKLVFDGARAGLGNRGALLTCARNRTPLRVKVISGRTLIYREGMDRDKIRQLINS